jgi:hypothetical protein
MNNIAKTENCIGTFVQLAINLVVVFFTLSFITGCQKSDESTMQNSHPESESKPPSVFDFNKNIGWLHGTCLAITNDNLISGSKVILVVLGDPQTLIKTTIQGVASAESGCFALFEDRVANNQKKNRSFYSVKLPDSESNTMAIGIVGEDIDITATNNKVNADLNSDGVAEAFGSCQTREGMKFFVWSGGANQGAPLWSDYYYLGYDLQPNCPEN